MATGGESYIETVWGRGYVLRDPVGGRSLQPALAGMETGTTTAAVAA
jgi:hypothetical protein